MKSLKSKYALWGAICFCLFLALIVVLKVVDVQPIGLITEEGVRFEVGLATINDAVRNFFLANTFFYALTEFTGYIVLLFMGMFALLGIYQLFSRKSLKKIDPDIYLLAGFYAVVLFFYLLFEVIVINYRPVLVGGEVEASFPSSHTMLAICIMATSIHQLIRRVKKPILKKAAVIFCSVIMAVTVIGRLISGLHWFTDIIGGILLSLALFFWYLAIYEKIKDK